MLSDFKLNPDVGRPEESLIPLSRTSDLDVQLRAQQETTPDLCSSSLNPTTTNQCLSVSAKDEEATLQNETHPTEGRTSIDAMLDQLEAAANFKPIRGCNQVVDDSLLIHFDPLVSAATEGAVEDQFQNTAENGSLLVNLQSKVTVSSEPEVVSHLISPLTGQQTDQLVVAVTPETPLSTGFTPIPTTRRLDQSSAARVPTSPFVFSPWMHRSILDQALGGGDQSPEWNEPTVNCSPEHQSPVSKRIPKIVTPNQLDFSATSEVEAVSVTDQEDLSHSYASAVAVPENEDFDMLADLLGRVNMHQVDSNVTDTNPKSEEIGGPSEDGRLCTQHTPNRPVVTTTAPGTYKIPRKSDTSSLDHLETTVSSPPHADSSKITLNTHSIPISRRLTFNLNTTESCNEPDTSITTDSPKHIPNQCSNRLSISSISDLVTKAARSLYDRIGGGVSVANVSAVSPAPVQSTPSSMNRLPTPSMALQHTRRSVSPKQSSPPPDSHHSRTNANDPLVHSVDEDVWESVNSMHENNSTAPDASIRVSGQTFHLSTDENKENVHISQTEASQPCYPSHQEQLCESVTESNSRPADGSPRPFSAARNGLHETQITPHLTASGDGPEQMKKSITKSMCNVSNHEQVSAEEWCALNDEVLHLRAVMDGLKSVMDAYEKTLVDSAASERARTAEAYGRILQVAAERDEAIDQASTMFKAYEDMYRRVQRAKETIETKKEKQLAAIKCIERYASRAKTVEEKLEQLNTYYLDRLTETLALQDRQEDEWQRKLDKMQLALRQHELRNNTLADEIHLKEQHCAELTEMSNKFFQ